MSNRAVKEWGSAERVTIVWSISAVSNGIRKGNTDV
jgi:hypothetical protein